MVCASDAKTTVLGEQVDTTKDKEFGRWAAVTMVER